MVSLRFIAQKLKTTIECTTKNPGNMVSDYYSIECKYMIISTQQNAVIEKQNYYNY
jgi:hypothetical protein